MNSKIRVVHNFEYNESFIQLVVNTIDGDNNDHALKNFVEQGGNRGIELVFNPDSDIFQIHPMKAQEQELRIVRAFKQMCEESTPPELTEAMESIFRELFRNRQALKGKEDLIME